MKTRNIMKKILIIVILASLFSNTLYAESSSAEDTGEVSYELYINEEFPDWLHKVRRAESLFIGSLPLTYGAVTLAANLFSVNTTGTLIQDDYLLRFGISAVVSFGIVLIDFLLGELHNE
ncbi:MAG: hypothetical protein HQ557_15825 [Bacteroidetes bacterium]|nr:hypothetical protein [Bacteroidota bacterium]